ncbi:hypothetical protein [Leifsonia sp. LS-T14]|uniref:hypothetical protein n=1 Tax=unclassified Leifsonia TaxID=2663824 RepID=UPI0035A74623
MPTSTLPAISLRALVAHHGRRTPAELRRYAETSYSAGTPQQTWLLEVANRTARSGCATIACIPSDELNDILKAATFALLTNRYLAVYDRRGAA